MTAATAPPIRLLLLWLVLLLTPAPSFAADPAKDLPWLTNYPAAVLAAQKADKVLLVYFSGSDWDEWGQKLDAEVLRTDLFRDWAAKNVVPVQLDTPKEKKLSPGIKAQNDRLKAEHNIVKVPTFLFIDPSGEVLARVGYDAAKLRGDEPRGEPRAWVEVCESVVKGRPAKEELARQPNLREGVAYARRHGVPLLLLVSQNPTPAADRARQALTANQQFVRFVNRNLAFVDVPWPADTDKGADAEFVRAFAAEWKFGPTPLGLVLWDPGGLGRLKDRLPVGGGDPQQVGALVRRLDAELPSIDYNGGWVEDYKLALAISHQQKKDLLIAFVSTGVGEWSLRMDREIFQTPEFQKYAKKNLVLLKADFPPPPAAAAPLMPAAAPTTRRAREAMATAKDGSQPPALRDQNKMLAELYGVRGFPTIILLNPLGQKIGDGKYMKGGPATFIAELEQVRRKDRDRRTLFSEEAK